jgi:hypothetical protein
MAEPGTLADLIERVDRYTAVESALFEQTGLAARRGGTTATLLAGISAHLAWHVELWRERRPHVGPVASVVDLPGSTSAQVDPDPRAVLEELAHVTLPPLIDSYEVHQALVDELVDAPTARVLRLVLADLRDDLARVREFLNEPASAAPARG